MIILKKRKKYNIGILLLRFISLIIVLVCILLLYNWNNENNENAQIADDLANDFVATESTTQGVDSTRKYEKFLVNFNNLLTQNEDTVAWIKLNNSNINFPIVKTDNNDFYLTHNFNKQENSAGWIFADHRNNFDVLDKNTIIYGHNRRNSTMFSNLKLLLNSNYFKEDSNKYFYFITKNANYAAEIFSVYKVNKNKLVLYNSFENEEQFNLFIDNYKQNSIYDFNIDVSYEDNIITLCTCDNNNKYRIVVFAKLIKLN